MTVKPNGVNTKITILATLRRKLEGNLLSTTTLRIRDCGAAGFAGRGMLALGTIRHGENKVDIGIKRHRDVEMDDGKLVVLTARNLWSTAATLRKGTLDTL